MRSLGTLLLAFGLVTGAVRAQDGAEDGDDGEVEIEIAGGADDTGRFGILADPFEERRPLDPVNKPEPIQVGEWTPPPLDKEARARHDDLLRQREEAPGDVGVRYRLADFYLEHKWYTYAEAEFLACARAGAASIRPWEEVLRLYALESDDAGGEEIVGPGFRIVNQRRGDQRKDWLTDAERRARILRAHREIIRRRPDDIARRRAFVEVLKDYRRLDELVEQCRSILERMPDAADARYDLADALVKRYVAARREAWERDGEAPPDGPPPAGPWDETRDVAIRLLEENLRRAPDHARSALRLARLIAERSGRKATGRIGELERRGAFHLAIPERLADVPYRKDTWRMLRDLVGPKIAHRLWDDAFLPGWYRDRRSNPWNDRNRIYYRRWIVVYFPHAGTRDRLPVIARLGRRADREAAGILATFLWHHRDWREIQRKQADERDAARDVEVAAIEAIAGLGSVAFPLAQRFLDLADTPVRRRRAIRILAGLDDDRAARPLVEALEWDRDPNVSLGVAPALARIGDPAAIDALVEAAFDVRRPLPRRVECAAALASFRDPRSIEALGRLRDEEGFAVVAGYGLYRLTGDADALEPVGEALRAADTAPVAFEYLRRCAGERARALLLDALRRGSPEMRPKVLAELRRRDGDTLEADVARTLLELAGETAIDPFVLEELGRMGGEAVATRLLERLEQARTNDEWKPLARALALTGDPRAVRHFNKLRILERDDERRRLASRYHELAARRAKQR